MHPALRSALTQLAQRLLFIAIAVAAVIGFVVVAKGSGAQTGQHETTIPITISADAPTAAPSSPPTTIAPDAGDSSAPQRGNPVQLTTTHKVVVSTLAVLTNAPAPASSRWSGSPGVSHQRGTRTTVPGSASGSASSSAAPVFHYIGMRDVAALVNPQREAKGFGDVTTMPAKNSAACVADSSCPGQVGACGTAPATIGTATSTQVADGQYRDQYGECREVIAF